MIRPALLALALAAAPLPALAHKVIMGIFPSGSQIEGEIGFSNGEVPEAQLVEIFDEAGNKLGDTLTDADGFFLFTPNLAVAHLFRANLGAGHVAMAQMSKEEVGAIIARGSGTTPGAAATIGWSVKEGQTPPDTAPKAAQANSSPAPSTPSLSTAELDAIARAVRDETRPLRQELSAYKEKNDLQTILGGLGYIAGLFGLGFYIAARRKLRESA